MKRVYKRISFISLLMLLNILIYAWGVYSINEGHICIGIMLITSATTGFMLYIGTIKIILRIDRREKEFQEYVKKAKKAMEKIDKEFEERFNNAGEWMK